PFGAVGNGIDEALRLGPHRLVVAALGFGGKEVLLLHTRAPGVVAKGALHEVALALLADHHLAEARHLAHGAAPGCPGPRLVPVTALEHAGRKGLAALEFLRERHQAFEVDAAAGDAGTGEGAGAAELVI